MKDIIKRSPVVAILRGFPGDKLLHYAEALIEGGITAVEVAMNTPDAAEQIRTLKKEFDGVLTIGAGTVITLEILKEAVEAGAAFLLSPSTDRPVLEYCRDQGIKFLPGVMTPTDVSTCLQYGFNTLKLFPAGDLPMSYIKSLKGPFQNTDYVAVGGVGSDNLRQFFESGFLGVGIGSNLVPKNYVVGSKWKEVSRYVRYMIDGIPK